VAAPSSVWQRFPLCHIESNGNENFKVIQNPGFLLDHPKNWITGSFCHSRHSQKISERSVHNFLSYLADTQTDKQTNKVWQKHNLLGGGKYFDSITCNCLVMIFIGWQHRSAIWCLLHCYRAVVQNDGLRRMPDVGSSEPLDSDWWSVRQLVDSLSADGQTAVKLMLPVYRVSDLVSTLAAANYRPTWLDAVDYRGRVFFNVIWTRNHEQLRYSTFKLSNASLNHFCFWCTDNAFSALEISSKW